MSENGSKITRIVEDVIKKNEIEFSKKSKSQQSNDISNIEEIIKLALAGRDQSFERDIILTEISKNVNKSDSYFFDSKGNFDISGFIEVTQKIVKDAEKDGKILPVGNQKNNRKQQKDVTFKEVVVSVAIISKLIDNYDKLSTEARNKLWDEYGNLSRKDQIRLEKADIKEWENLSKEIGDSELAEISKNQAKLREKLSELNDKAFNGDKKAQEDELKFICSDKYFINEYKKKNPNFNVEFSTDLINEYQKYSARIQGIRREIFRVIDRIRGEKNNTKKEKLQEQLVLKISEDAEFIEQYRKDNRDFDGKYCEDIEKKYIDYSNEKAKQEINNQKVTSKKAKQEINIPKETYDDLFYSDEESKEFYYEKEHFDSRLNHTEENIQKTSNNMVNEKLKFNEQDVKVGLQQYKECLKSFDEETLADLADLTNEEIVAGIKEGFNEMIQAGEITSEVGDILAIISDVNYENIKDTLTDSKKRESLISKLEELSTMDFETKGAEVVTEVTEQQFTDDELKQVFNEYFKANSVEMDVSAIEMQSEKAEVVEAFDKSEDSNGVAGLNQDDVVNSFDENMESVSDEDNATQGSTSSGAKKFSLNEVKAVASGVKMPEIQDSTQLIREELNKDLEKEEEQEVQTV